MFENPTNANNLRKLVVVCMEDCKLERVHKIFYEGATYTSVSQFFSCHNVNTKAYSSARKVGYSIEASLKYSLNIASKKLTEEINNDLSLDYVRLIEGKKYYSEKDVADKLAITVDELHAKLNNYWTIADLLYMSKLKEPLYKVESRVPILFHGVLYSNLVTLYRKFNVDTSLANASRKRLNMPIQLVVEKYMNI